MEKIRVLFLAASPSVSPLSLDQEIRSITAKIRAAAHRESLEVISKWAVRPDDLQQALLEHRPHVLHFSGHGTESEELVLLDSQGNPKPVSKAALANLLSVLKDNLRLVVLNACFSRPQAEAITQVIDCAVGMNRAVGDEAAIKFAAAFYGAIGFGRSIQTAFDLGRNELMLNGIPEESTPELVAHVGVDPGRIVLVPSPAAQSEVAAGPSPIAVALVSGNNKALDLWRQKLAYFEEQEAIASDPAQKFALRHQIEEIHAKIQKLGG